jgi:hypothetical protein
VRSGADQVEQGQFGPGFGPESDIAALVQGAFPGLRTVRSFRTDSRIEAFNSRCRGAGGQPLAGATRLENDAGPKLEDFACISCSLAAAS